MKGISYIKTGIQACFTGFLLFMVVASVTSCKTKEKLPKSALKDKSTEYLFEQLAANELRYEYFSARVSAKLKTNKASNSFSARLRMKKDSVIWASITPALGIEAARIYITPDTLKFIDRINSKYFLGSFDMVNEMFDTEIDFEMLEAIIVGNNFTYFKTDKFESAVGKDHYILNTIRRRELKKEFKEVDSVRIILQNIWLNPDQYKIDRMALKDIQSNKKLECVYSDFKEIGGQLFAHLLNVDIKARAEDNAQAQVELEYSKVELDEPQNFPMKIPEKYEPIIFKKEEKNRGNNNE